MNGEGTQQGIFYSLRLEGGSGKAFKEKCLSFLLEANEGTAEGFK
jgi:hypothetical protein